MKGDFSRRTFNPRRRYSGVLMQQGRVQLDADWNEQLEIQHHRTETESVDVIGAAGVPKGTDGFRIEPLTPEGIGHPTDLAITDGRIYVDGLLCELDATSVPVTFVDAQPKQAVVADLTVDGRALVKGQWLEMSAADVADKKLLRIEDVDEQQRTLTFAADITAYQNAQQPVVRRVLTYATQADYPAPPFVSQIVSDDPQAPPPEVQLDGGLYLAYLHVWERHVTALDDELIREQALGGPDTTTRVQNVWQVELLAVADQQQNQVDCQTSFPEWDSLIAQSTGTMNARTQAQSAPTNPCSLPPSAGYQGLENQLYRVEVQKGGPRDQATFKWSRENGSVQTSIEKVDDKILTVAEPHKDDVLGFKNGQWVELVDDETELLGTPRPLAQITDIDETLRQITLDASATSAAGQAHLKLRRWDQPGAAGTTDGIAMTADWLDLEDGIQVQFSDGTYRAGDYWLIPARTATAEIEWPPYAVPNLAPLAQSPQGIRHHYCRLALLTVSDGVVSLFADCRQLFPPLTHICAEDVCYDNGACQLPNVKTVQDALDRLCSERDLRFHNKHLHGWGIVCGLQVDCGPDDPNAPPRRHVTVRSGYAIDCEGNDIIHETDEPLDLLQMIADYNTLHPNAPILNGDGEVCLVLTGDAEQPYALAPYDPAWNSWSTIFKGTLWSDVFNDCLLPLAKFWHDETTPAPDEAQQLVGPTQQRLTTLMNLLIQLINPTNGRYVYLSGEQGLDDLRTEHSILQDLYDRLRALLQSSTFCGMFDNDPFPVYPFKGLNNPTTAPPYSPTIFGKGFHTRLRLHPSGRLAYTIGSGNTINVYDLRTNEIASEVKFPDDSALVRDVAFSRDGRQLYAVGTIKNTDSMFAVADITGTNLKWRTPTVICDAQLLTLATAANVPGKVYAIGRGKGLYELDLKNLAPNATPLHACNASGQLTIFEQGTQAYAFVAVRGAGTPTLYDQVLRFDLHAKQAQGANFNLFANGQHLFGADDIAVASTRQGVKLYVVTNPPPSSNNKHLLVFNQALAKAAATPTLTDLGAQTAIRLAYNDVTQALMLTYADEYCVRLIGPNDQLVPQFRQPVQISPMAIAIAADGRLAGHRRVYVLNYNSNTITSMPAEQLTPKRQLDLDALANYRAAVLEAFAKLLGGLLQYLKDCFCHHLLVDCPECQQNDQDDQLYLACIAIKGGEVYQICNFSRRKYVKTFPTVEYWLSLVPIVPLISRAFETFCCAALPDLFAGYKAPQAGGAQNKLSSQALYTVTSVLHETNKQQLFSNLLSRFAQTGGRLLRDWFVCAANDREQPPALLRENIVGLPAEDALRVLRQHNVSVAGAQSYEPCNGLANLLQQLSAPQRLDQQAQVTLVVEDGIVRHYTVHPDAAALATGLGNFPDLAPAGAQSGATTSGGISSAAPGNTLAGATTGGATGAEQPSEATTNLHSQLSELRSHFARTHAEFTQAQTARDETIARLQAETQDLRSKLEQLSEQQAKPKPARRRRSKTSKPDKPAE
jgi:Family of unknown function (DUF6519)